MDIGMKKLVFTLICLLPVFTSQATIITVDDNGSADFDNIQDAIDSSGLGDTIVVKPGIYNQRIFFKDKPVTLTSEDPDDRGVVESTIITFDSGYMEYSVNFDFGEGHNSVLRLYYYRPGHPLLRFFADNLKEHYQRLQRSRHSRRR